MQAIFIVTIQHVLENMEVDVKYSFYFHSRISDYTVYHYDMSHLARF